MARISIKDLVKTFGAYTAVNGISLDIRDGEFLIMVGPSGCGKTTTLNMISGLETPTSGEIVIGNTVVNDLEPGERGLGMVFQDLALFPHMTVFENIAFGLRVKKVPDGEVRQRVRGRRGSRAHRAAARQASAPMLRRREPARRARPHHRDQPGGVPDGRAVVEPRRQASGRHAHRAQGACTSASRRTFVYVTHDQAEAMTMADRIVVMSKGRIEQVGTPLQIYNRPATRFVAGFFGMPTMNFVEGDGRDRTAADSSFAQRASSSRCPMPCRPASPAARSCSACARSMCCSTATSAQRGTVQLTEPLGDATLVHFDYGQAAPLVAKAGPTTPLQPGGPLSFRFSGDHCHLFGAENGDRLF